MKKNQYIHGLLLTTVLLLAPLNSMAEETNSLLAVIQGMVKTVVDLIYEFNPSLPDTIKGNTLNTLMDKKVASISDNLSLNIIRYQLSDYLGFRSMHQPINPKKTEDQNGISNDEDLQIYNYLHYVITSQDKWLLNPPESIPFPSMKKAPSHRDTYTLIQKTRAALRISQPVKHETGVFGTTTTTNPLYNNATPDERQAIIKLLAPSGLTSAFNTLVTEQSNCAPFPPKKENEKEENQYPDCILDIEGKHKIEQKMLHAILQGDNNLYDQSSNADGPNYGEGDRHYSLQSLIQPLSYSTPAQKEAAEDFIKSIKKYAGMPSTRPPELPNVYTPKQMKAVNDQMAKDKRDKKEVTFMEGIEMNQQSYMDGVRALLAAQDLAMSNLYQAYAERVPQPILQSQPFKVMTTNAQGIPSITNINIESPLKLKAYLAKRRLSKDFLEKMAKASPATIARETLSVMSEIRAQLFENQQTMKRMLLAFTLMQLTAVQSQSKSLTEQARLIQRKINELLDGKAGESEKFAPSDGSSPDPEELSATANSGG